MKRILLATVILIGASQAMAQTSGSNSSNAPSVSSSTAPKNTKGKKAQAAPADTLNNREMYNWKNGQRATPTGHEATGTNSGYSALGRDSATATRRDSTKQQ